MQSLPNLMVKDFENQSTFAEDMDKNQVSSFLTLEYLMFWRAYIVYIQDKCI